MGAGAALRQRVRPDGDDGGRVDRGVPGGRPAAAPHRQPATEHAPVRPGRQAAARAGWRARGAVRRRRGGGARLPEPSGADGGEVPARSLLRGGGGEDVPHRRPGAVAGRRGARVPGADRPAGEAAGLPDRAGRDRGGPLPASGRGGGCGRGARRRCGEAARRGRGGGGRGRARARGGGEGGGDGFVAPRTEAEEVLAEIWRGLLGLDRLGVNDSFFDLGGDSILSIQVVSRAQQAGLHLTTRQVFEHPTVAGLAAVAEGKAAPEGEQGEVTGAVPLTPIQRWFFEQDLPERHHFNQSVLLKVRARVERGALEAALAALLRHHDALRLRFSREAGRGEWRQVNAGYEEMPGLLQWVDLSDLAAERRREAVEELSEAAQASPCLARGPLPRAVYFDLGSGQGGRLLLVIHHLAVDVVSWRILLEDLEVAYRQAPEGTRPA